MQTVEAFHVTVNGKIQIKLNHFFIPARMLGDIFFFVERLFKFSHKTTDISVQGCSGSTRYNTALGQKTKIGK